MQVNEPTKENLPTDAVPVKRKSLKDSLKKGNRIAIDGNVFRVVNIDYFSGSVVLKFLPQENVFFKPPQVDNKESQTMTKEKEESNGN